MCYRMRRFEKSAEENDRCKEDQELIFTVDDASEVLAEARRTKTGRRRTEE